MTKEITYIRKSGEEQDCSCITDVKTSMGDIYPVRDVITLMTSGETFFVKGNFGNVDVISVPESNPWYIRTEPNDTLDDNLLQLPTF